MLITLLIILLLLLLSAFFSGSETALTATSQSLIHRYAQQGLRRAKIVGHLLKDKEFLLGTILLGNNVANILTTSLVTALLIQILGPGKTAWVTFVSVAIVTPVLLIFSEIMPKTIAVQWPDKISMWVAPFIAVIKIILYPLTYVLLGIARFFSRLISPERNVSDILTTAEAELRGAIELHQGDDPKDLETAEQEKLMMRSILDLNDVTIGEIMTHRRQLEMIDATLPVDDIVNAVWKSSHTRLPLYEGSHENVVGVLHARDILHEVLASKEEQRAINLADICATPWFVPDSTSALDQMQAFKERSEHFALVIDEYGALQGVVTLEDILEEIVGEITDEHDETEDGIMLQSDGSYLVAGETTLRDLNRKLHLHLSDAYVTTVAGLLLYTTKRIPDKGQIFLIHGCRFEIVERQRHRITLLKVQVLKH